jgi:NAD(P)-dependent dehydrogenase (short-subunit alcohol dehydrogenase family)
VKAEKRFEGRVAVVTGGASGIGLAVTRRLIAEGASVVMGDVNASALEKTAAELGEAVHPVEADVRLEAQVEAMVRAAVDHFGGLHAAVNAAGIGGFGPITELREEDWDLTVDVCLKGVFLAVKHEAKQMLAQGSGGAIVNVASLNAHVPLYGGAAYACAKAGVEMLSRNAALELSAQGIRVNTVSPGLTDTPMTAPLRAIDGVYEAYFDRIPMRRGGTPEEMAAAAIFLLSDEATYISGSNLVVDGAWETTGYPDLRPFVAELLEKM